MTEQNDNNNDSQIPVELNNNVHVEGLKDSGLDSNKKTLHSIPDMSRTMVVKRKVEGFSLDDLGKIENAKKHRSANRCLHKLKDFTNEVNFCWCCNLPCEEKGIIEPFHFCDDIEMFSECGLGVTLYYYFFLFCAVIAFMGICVLSISLIVFNDRYTDGINTVCNKYNNDNINGLDQRELGYCKGFVQNSKEGSNYYNRFNRWILRFSSDNILVYRKLPKFLKNEHEYEEKNVEDVLINYSILNFCFLMTTFILNIFFIIFIKAQAQKAKLLNFSIRDYTVLVSEAKPILFDYLDMKNKENPNIFRHSQITIENGKQFKTYVNDYIRLDKNLIDLKINNINMCYDLGNYIEYRDEYEECKKKIFQVRYNPHNQELNIRNGHILDDDKLYYRFPFKTAGLYCCHDNGFPLKTLLKKKDDLEKQLDSEQQEITQYITEQNFTGYMFVSFNKIKDKEIILSHYPHNFFDMGLYFLKNIKYYLFCCCLSRDDIIRFRRAKGIDVYDPPEPEDIIWENFNYTARQRGIRTIIVFIICILIMILSFALVFGLTFAQDYLYDDRRGTKSNNVFLKYLISLAITLVINILNVVIELVLEKLTHLEKQISRSNYILSLSIKISIFTFLNSAIVPLLSKHIVRIISENEFDKNNEYYNRSRERDNLLIDDMLIYFIVNAIFSPLLWTFSFTFIIKKIRICCINRAKNPDGNHYMTQRELNNLYEYPDMDLAYKYSYLIKTLAMALFYMPIFPMGFIFAFVGFVFGYLLELFNFTHLYKRPEMLDEIITQVYSDYFIVLLFIGGIGDYFFLYDVFPSPDHRWALINIILFGVLIVIPYTKFFNCNFAGIDKSEYQNFPLSDVYFTFYNDYQRQNPLTKRIGLINYLTELKKNEYLSDNAFEFAKKNIENLNIMEIYYGISRGNIPLTHQSILANSKNDSVLSTGNLVKSILHRGLLKSTVIKPDLGDNPEEKKKKRRFFESQIVNMFGRGNFKNNLKNYNTINEADEYDNETKDQLADAYNNPLGINMGLGALPLTTSIYKDKD